MRNTPVGTGKNLCHTRSSHVLKKHPRGDGEEVVVIQVPFLRRETPPWGRGRNKGRSAVMADSGNTPVGTGKNFFAVSLVSFTGKHPRGDGEEPLLCSSYVMEQETPPWGRGRTRHFLRSAFGCGNTPVGTGKNQLDDYHNPCMEKHPRGDGEECNILYVVLPNITTYCEIVKQHHRKSLQKIYENLKFIGVK